MSATTFDDQNTYNTAKALGRADDETTVQVVLTKNAYIGDGVQGTHSLGQLPAGSIILGSKMIGVATMAGATTLQLQYNNGTAAVTIGPPGDAAASAPGNIVKTDLSLAVGAEPVDLEVLIGGADQADGEIHIVLDVLQSGVAA